MKKLLVMAVIAASLVSLEAKAQSRAGGAAVGAVSGAVVLGPVGAVAGAVIGYTAGPAIAHSWGIGRSAPPPRTRRSTRSDPAIQQQASAKVAPSSVAKAPETPAVKNAAPPVQGFD
ncbi:MAG TPA: DNA-directed RNA polymerase subunit N [Xanthobacteraceae bacterium]|jgi:hypothetical protein